MEREERERKSSQPSKQKKLQLGLPLIRLVEAAIRLEAPARQFPFLPTLVAIGQRSTLPIIQHGEMGKGPMREVGEWHRFLEVFVLWLALIDEAYDI